MNRQLLASYTVTVFVDFQDEDQCEADSEKADDELYDLGLAARLERAAELALESREFFVERKFCVYVNRGD